MERMTARAAEAEAAGRARGRLFYGWWVALGCCVITFVSAGVGFYGPGVFLATLHEREGWSRGALSLATTAYFLTSGLYGLIVGRWVDRHGPRGLFVFAAVVMAVALVLLGRVTALWQVFAVYLLLAPAQASMSNIPVTTTLARWFVRRRAQALSIAMSGISLGGMVLAPVTVALIDRLGLGVTTLVLAAMVLALVLPVTAFVIRREPAALGLTPDGDPRPMAAAAGPAVAPPPATWTPATAARTRAFWIITAAFMLGLAAQQAFLIHQISFLSGVIGRGTAGAVLSVTAGASIVGRLALGPVSDRLDKRWVAAVCFAAQGVGVLVVLHTAALPAIYVAMLAFGLTMGNSYIMLSLLTAERFGGATFGAVYGLLSVFVMTGSASGPLFAGALADAAGGYTLPLTITSATSIAMGLLILTAPKPNAPG